MVPLGGLDDRCQVAIQGRVLVRVLDELILLQHVFNDSLLPVHLVLQNLDLSLQLCVLFLVLVCQLLDPDGFIIESLCFLLVEIRRGRTQLVVAAVEVVLFSADVGRVGGLCNIGYSLTCCVVDACDGSCSLGWDSIHGVGSHLALCVQLALVMVAVGLRLVSLLL